MIPAREGNEVMPMPMKKEIGQPFIILTIVVVTVLVGVFGWWQLRTPAPNVTPQETKGAVTRQMDMMKDAFHQMRQKSQPGSR